MLIESHFPSRKAREILFIRFLSCSFWFDPRWFVALGRTEISTLDSGMLLSCILSLHLWVHGIISSCITHHYIVAMMIGECALLVIINSLIVKVILIAIRIIIALLVLSSLSLIRITCIVFRHAAAVRTVILIIILRLHVFIKELQVGIQISIMIIIVVRI